MERVAIRPWCRGCGGCAPTLDPKTILLRSIFCPKTLSFGNILGGKLGQFGGGGGEVELFGGEASPAPPSLDETLLLFQCIMECR